MIMAGGCQHQVGGTLFRKKTVDLSTITDTKLARCLSTLDLTALGIGSTLGIGIYVIAGQVAREQAGPSVTLSFLIAAIASVFAGLCYAEFGSRVPKTGSAYVYSYVTVGELVAFIVGWNLILEYVIATASVARGWTAYFDSLIDHKLQHFWQEHLPMHVSFLGPYPDFFAMAFVCVLTVVLAIGVKESSVVNNLFTAVNLFVVVYVIICGCFKVNVHNWSIPESEVPVKVNGTYGTGGFFPYGFSGTLSGAATCFYAFVGFDCIATTGEEVRNPQKAIPISIILCLTACFLAYFGISTVLTLMLPYYELDLDAPLTVTFGAVGYSVAKIIIAVGALAGLSASLLGAMFPMPRIVYAMAEDGLLFKFLALISPRFKTPVPATLISGFFAGVMALLFDLNALVEMMSIGTLLAYTLVAACILILRYEMDDVEGTEEEDQNLYNYGSIDGSNEHSFRRNIFLQIFKPNKTEPDSLSHDIVKWAVFILGVLITLFCAVIIFLINEISQHKWWAITLGGVPLVIILLIVTVLHIQPQNQQHLSFKVPLVPIIPVLSIFVNIYLMLKLRYMTWIRFGVWMAIGFIIYFSYGIWNSSLRHREKKEINTDLPVVDEVNNITNIDTVNHEPDSHVDGNDKRYLIPPQ